MAGSVLGKPDPMDVLSNSWYHLRLSVRYPQRVPTWDAIILTAASPEQAELYEWQLKRAKRMERIAESTVAMAVPDPQGARIGSGAATLSAIRALADHLALSRPQVFSETVSDEEPYGLSIYNQLVKMRILLLHAGGDSKRVPWANPMGKVFLPLPYLAEEDPDGPVPLLFDHILAVSSCVLQAFKDKGGLFIMTGDVLPCFDTSTMVLPDDGACVVTVPTTLDIAVNHGVIVISSTSMNATSRHNLDTVENLLQKPSLKELANNGAIQSDGRALLDTGIFAVRGKAWQDIIKLSSSSPELISELLKRREEVSLYEDLAGAWVSTKHEWMKTRPLGLKLLNALGGQKLFTYCAYDLLFLHFGTSSEILDHLGEGHAGRVGRRHLSSIPASTCCDLATSAVILSSEIASGTSVGDDSLIYDSTLSSGVQIGSRCVVVGVHIEQERETGSGKTSPLLVLPDRHCLWEVPLLGNAGRVILCCGLEDNPKSLFSSGGTFCGKPWGKVFSELGIQESNLWDHRQTKQECLWNAKLFPILPQVKVLKLAMWLMGFNLDQSEDMLHLWKRSNRVSLEEMHRCIDYQQLCAESSNHRAKIAAGITKACISYGLLGRNLSRLCAEIVEGEKSGMEICKSFLALCPNPQACISSNLPQSRAYQVQVDLYRACGEEKGASVVEENVWAAVVAETAAAVKQGLEDQVSKPLNSLAPQICDGNDHQNTVSWPFHLKRVRVELPVRVDFVGGWSDTPPWSLERIGCVLNMAIHLEDTLPVGAEILVTSTAGILIHDDIGNQLHIEDAGVITAPFHEEDPFRLVKAALAVTGLANSNQFTLSTGLEISTWANVPRGSGLGTSSILAAAVVKGLLHVMGGDDSNENVAQLVLVLEQLMGTGGGWQDQIGGLYPGIKCTTSFPGKPLRLNVETVSESSQFVSELEQRMLVVFTGQVRLAHKVLQKVVARYLQRDALLITSIKRLAKLAKIGRESLMIGNLDDLGRIMLEAWRLHQELDPYCSNEFVDKLFKYADPFCCGYKLVGAGGGGFALLLARNREAADSLRDSLKSSSFPVKVYSWSLCSDGLSNLSYKL